MSGTTSATVVACAIVLTLAGCGPEQPKSPAPQAEAPAPAPPKPPTFTVWAAEDPDGANLDRIQIVKGWVDANGEPRDKVFDVAWSGNRRPGAGGRLPPVGNTVDLENATYTNRIGGAELMGRWTDSAFDPKRPALYYVRVLEIPTPRWTTYDAVRNNLPLLKDVPATVQERAWTSPIWYTP